MMRCGTRARHQMDEVEQRMGFVPDPDATIEKLREMLRAEGIRPEDNAFSREIIRMRCGEDEEPVPTLLRDPSALIIAAAGSRHPSPHRG